MDNGLTDDEHRDNDDDDWIRETGQGLLDGKYTGNHKDKYNQHCNEIAAHPVGNKKDHRQAERYCDDKQFTVHDVSV